MVYILRKWWLVLLVAALGFSVDRLSKYICFVTLIDAGEVKVTSFFSLWVVFNYGVSFSMLTGLNIWVIFLVSLVALGVVLWLLSKLFNYESLIVKLALGLLLGGALGNMYDRASLGSVIDFLYFHYHQYGFPVFNGADICITVAACLLGFELIMKRFTKKV